MKLLYVTLNLHLHVIVSAHHYGEESSALRSSVPCGVMPASYRFPVGAKNQVEFLCDVFLNFALNVVLDRKLQLPEINSLCNHEWVKSFVFLHQCK